MKFLSKKSDSEVLEKGLTYQENKPDNNRHLKYELIKEQKNFCAYTEKYIQDLDAIEVEHFDSSLKYADDYYNYYAVIRKANQYKKDNKYANSEFFKTRFFQSITEFNSRVKFKDGFYFQANESDIEAKELIDFLGFNNPGLYEQRKRHVKRLAKSFENAKYNEKQCIKYFQEHIEELSFITALEDRLQIELEDIL